MCISVYWGLWASVGTYTHRNAPLSHSRLGLRPGNGVNLSLSVPGWSHPSRLWVQMPGSAGWVQDLDPVCRAVSLAEGLLRGGHSPAAGHGSFISPHAGGMENHHVSGCGYFSDLSGAWQEGTSQPPFLLSDSTSDLSKKFLRATSMKGLGVGDTPHPLSACLDSLCSCEKHYSRHRQWSSWPKLSARHVAVGCHDRAAAAPGPSLHDWAEINSSEARATTERRHWVRQLILFTWEKKAGGWICHRMHLMCF